ARRGSGSGRGGAPTRRQEEQQQRQRGATGDHGRDRLLGVGRLRRLLDLLGRLVEQLLGLLGVTAEIELVGLLRVGQLVERLGEVLVRRVQVRVLLGAHVLGGGVDRLLREGQTASQQRRAQQPRRDQL